MSRASKKPKRGVRQILRRAKFGARELRAKIKRKTTAATVIAVTGSSAKTTTVSLLLHILSGDHGVTGHAVGNGYGEAVKSLANLRREDKFAVLEQGTDAPGQLARAAKLIKPDVAVVTLVAIEHYTSFRSIEAVAKEKAAFVESLSRTGLAILNFDDPNVRVMAQLTGARSVTFGTTGGDYLVSDLATSADGSVFFTLIHAGQKLELEAHLIGKYNWLTVAGAATTALELGIAPARVKERIATFKPLVGRMSAHTTREGSRIILDTVKAPYHSVKLPLDALSAMATSKRRFVLGQISDYAGNPTKKYRDTYAAAAKVADEVCFVGPTAHKARVSVADVESGKFRAFSNLIELAEHLKRTAHADEVIMVKSSKNLHLERLMLDRFEDVQCWPMECGVKRTCMECGQYTRAFSEHNGRPPK